MSHEVRKPEQGLRRSLRNILLIGAVSTVAACGSSKSSQAPRPESSRSSSGNTPTNTSGYPKPPADFAWGKRIRLTRTTYGKWDEGHPEPLQGKHLSTSPKYLLAIDDGRFNYPADPNPATDAPTGLYAVPTQQSTAVTKVPDGTVLKVIGWTNNGQAVSDAHGGSGYSTWEEVVGHDGTKAWVPWVNVGYTALSLLHELPNQKVGR